MKNLTKIALLLAVCWSALLVAGCDTDYQNDGWIENKTGANPRVATINIEGCEYIAFKTSYGYWNYTLKGNGNCGPASFGNR